MIRGLLAFLTILFLLISTALLIIGSVSIPATFKLSSKMMLAKLNGNLLGIFGTCSDNGQNCSKTSFGYSVDDSLVQEFYYKGDKRYVLSKVLITHIIGCGMSFLSACLVFLSFFVVKQALNIFNILFVALTALVTCCALGVELALFLPHNTWQSYVVAGAVGSDLLALLNLCFRSASISRMHTHKNKEEAVPSNATADNLSAYKEKDNYPLTMDDKLTNVSATLPKFNNDALTSASDLGPPSERGDSSFKKDASASVQENSLSLNTPSGTRSGYSGSRDNLLKIPSHNDNPYAKSSTYNFNNNIAGSQNQNQEQSYREYSPHKTGRAPGFPLLNTSKQGSYPLLSSDPFSKSDSSPTSSDDTYSSFFDVNPDMRLADSKSTQGQPSSPVNEHPFSEKATRPFAAQPNNIPTRVSDARNTKLPTKATRQTQVPDVPIEKQHSRPGSLNGWKPPVPGNATKPIKNLSRENLNTNSSETVVPNAQRYRKPASLNGSFNDSSSIPPASAMGVPRPFNKRPAQKPARNTMERSRNHSQASLASAFSGPSIQPTMSKAEMRNPANLAPVSSTLDQLAGNADFELPLRGGRNNKRSDGVSRMIR